MRQTYELYLEDEAGKRRFEPFLCAFLADVVPKARTLMAEQNLVSVEVRQAGEHLFTLTR